MALDRARAQFRIALLVLVLVLGAATFVYLKGPAALQRRYYPLERESAIAESSARHEVSPYLVAAVIDVESSWDEDARSSAGAVGLMQIMPSTAAELARRGDVDEREYPVERLSDPRVNIEYGASYLRYLVERYHEVETALAAYNAGIANADVWSSEGGDIREHIEFPETRHFVVRVTRAKERYMELYPDEFEASSRGE